MSIVTYKKETYVIHVSLSKGEQKSWNHETGKTIIGDRKTHYFYRRSSVICLYVCWTRSWALQKRLNRSRYRLSRLMWAREPCVRWGHDRTNVFASGRGDKSAMRPFVKILWPFVIKHLLLFIVTASVTARKIHIRDIDCSLLCVILKRQLVIIGYRCLTSSAAAASDPI